MISQRTFGRLSRRLLALGASMVLVGTLVLTNLAVVSGAKPPPSSNAAVDLDQCRNGGLVLNGTQTVVDCAGVGSGNDGWVNGNAGAANAHYAEGESISYRARVTGVQNNDQIVLVMGYDVVHSGVHAIDYLTDKNRWQTPETTVAAHPDDPDDTVGNQAAPTSTAAIPQPTTNVQVDVSKTLASGDCQKAGAGATQQPVTSFLAVPAAERVMEFFGGTNGVVAYVGPAPSLLDHNGDQEQQISVSFKATRTNPVIAWGGHIASRLDWGCADGPQSASGISGSPYHMRIKSISVNGVSQSLGNQDRSLSAGAVIFVSPGISTTPSAGGPIGTVLNDTATLSGAISPTGSITFKLFPPSDATCAGTPVYTQAVALNGATTVSTSPGYTSLVAGTYRWTATYPGDGHNAPASSGCQAEQVTIAKNSPTLGTTPSAAGPIGTVLNDTATLSGASNPTGSIVFNLFGPDDVDCDGTAVYTQTVALSGNSAATSPGYTTTAAGKYAWTASYAGDANNNPASSGCTAEEVVIGKNSPTASTAQNLIPNDTFTLSGATSNAGGTVDFYLFAPGETCGVTNIANAAYTEEDVALVSNDHASTSNTGSGTGMYKATAEGTYTWLAVYSGDANNNGATSNCVETFSIDN